MDEAEFEVFTQRLIHNRKSLTSGLASATDQILKICSLKKEENENLRGEAQKIEKYIADLQKEIELLGSKEDESGKELKKHCQVLEKLTSSCSKMESTKEKMNSEIAELEKNVSLEQKNLKVVTQKKNEHISKFAKGLQMYNTHLGMRIQRTESDALLFVFTQISRADPEKEYMCKLRIEGDEYKLLSSSPPLPDLKLLEDRLNETNNISGFTVHIRKLYQKLQ